MVGKTVSHYKILEELGSGGMGVVYKAEDIRLGRVVALKFLPEELSHDAAALTRFEREARSASALNHPHICTLHDIGEHEGQHFIVFELLDGENLRERLSSGPLELDELFDVALQVADALQAAHERGIIHRDIKPANIFLTEQGQAKVLDFGLAKWKPISSPEAVTRSPDPELTVAGGVVGTLRYMSPEQAVGDPVDARSDVFSLGLVLYEMATGQRAVSAKSRSEAMRQILQAEPEPISSTNQLVPREFEGIVGKCLEKDPQQRYPSARELAADLGRLRRGEAVVASLRRGKRRRRQVIVAVAASLLLLTLAAVLWLRSPPTRAGPYSIAVLPFTNLTGDAAQDYLSDGIAAGLISQLGELSGLQIVSRSEAWSYRGKNLGAAQLARRLGVEVLLEGEVQRQMDELRVNANLTDVTNSLVLWSQSFEGRLDDLFELQSKIAREVADYLSVPLSAKERRRLAKDPTRSRAAYDYFLKGQRHLEDQDPLSSDLATEMFRQAIRLDPDFALAHVGLSEALWKSYGRDKDREKLDEAEREAERAREIDPELAAAQVALARVYRSTGRAGDSIDELRQVLEHHPKPDEAYRELAQSYRQIGDLEEAEKFLQVAAALDSEDWFNWNWLGVFYLRTSNYPAAREALERAASFAPDEISVPQENLVALAALQGRFEDAIAAAEQIAGPIRSAPLASNIGSAYYFSDRADKWEKAEEYFRRAVELNPTHHQLRRNLADLYQTLGRREESLRQYQKARELVEKALEDNPESGDLRVKLALYASKTKDCSTATPLAKELQATLPQTGLTAHDLAVAYALCGEEEAALAALRVAVDEGFSPRLIRQEDEFQFLWKNPEFERLVGAASVPTEDSSASR